MDFELSPEQVLLQDTVRRLMAADYSFAQRREIVASPEGVSRTVWRNLAQMGLLALPFPGDYGGLDASGVETMVCMQEFGRALLVEPYLETVVVVGGILARLAPAVMAGELLPRIATGDLMAAFADQDGAHPVIASEVGGAWILEGVKHHVAGATAAEKFLVSAKSGNSHHLFIVDRTASGVLVHGYPTHDGRRAATVTLSKVVVEPAAVVAADAHRALDRVRDEAAAAVCAEAVGAMEEALSMTIQYLQTRRQFGVAIGSFQALRHKVADMQVALEHARSMAIAANLRCRDDDDVRRRRAVSSAKVQIGNSGRLIGQTSVQLHGAIGMTSEYSVGHYLTRLEAIGKSFGDTAEHVEHLAACGGALD